MAMSPAALAALLVGWTAMTTMTTTTAKPTSLVIHHQRSEGSHALVERLNAHPCTRFFAREDIGYRTRTLRKFFGASTYAGVPAAFNVSQGSTLDAPTADPADSSTRNATKLQEQIEDYVKLMAIKEAAERRIPFRDDAIECACESRGLLVRADAEDAARDWCEDEELFKGGASNLPTDVRVLVLVRLDLLRYALSSYDRHDPLYEDHANPQFQLRDNKTATLLDLRGGRETYNITYLEQSVQSCLRSWSEAVELIQRLNACGIKPIVSAYEVFDDAGFPEEFVPSLVEDCASSPADFLKWRAFKARYAAAEQVIRKVHSYKISEYAANPREVLHWFMTQEFPSFAQFAKRTFSLDVETLEWL